MQIDLWKAENEKGSYSVTAYIENGCLKIIGQDLYPNKENIFNASEYEYIYSFDNQNTDCLLDLISDDGLSIDTALLSKFGGEDGCAKLREFCEVNEIKYTFYSHFDTD